MEAVSAETARPAPEEASNLTHRQLLIWAEHKLDPAVPANNMVMTFEIRGPLSPDRFEAAFRAVVAGTDSLRLVVEEGAPGSPQEGVPRQRALEAVPFELPVIDLEKEADPARAGREWVRTRSVQPFDLGARLFDTALLQLGPECWVWYLCQHHIITDATSFSLIYQRTAELYEQTPEGAPATAPGWPSFLDYLAFERRYRESPRASAAEAYWQEKLAVGAEPPDLYGRTLPAELPAVQRTRRDIGPERTRAIEAIGRDEVKAATPDLSSFVVFLTLLTAYLHRISGSTLIAIGTPYLNRRSRAFRDTAGIFMEVCVLRIPVNADDSFATLLTRVKDEVYASFTQGQWSLGNPVQRRNFDVILNFQSAGFPSFAGMPTRAESATGLSHLGSEGASLAEGSLSKGSGRGVELLTLQVQDFDAAGRRVCDFDFPASLFDSGAQQRAVGHFGVVLDAFLEGREALVGDVSVLSGDEQRSLLAKVAAAHPAPSGTIYGRFAIQAARTPDTLAVRCGERSLSFRDLDAQGNRIARHLAAHDVSPGDVVGLCVERSLDMVPALLGILKAGAAFLPLDPSYPGERLRWMLDDSLAAALITQDDLRERIAAPGLAVVCVDSDADLIAAQDASLAEVALPDDAIAHLLYTSGSTGQPKGVLGPHRAALNRFEWMWDAYPFEPGEVACQKTALSFVDSVWEIFGPLLKGVTNVVIPDDEARDPRSLVDALAAANATRIVLVPSLLQAMIETSPDLAARLPALRLWFTSGEVLPATLAAAFYRTVPEARLVNLYGSTEVAGDVTHYVVPAEDIPLRVPIGRPIRNTAAAILDERGRPVPLGVTGELFVAGANLAAGYHRRSDLTAERFTPDRECGELLFRTGDRCRVRPDGDLELVGRVDDQLKVRGYRIEPAEVEAALLRHPAVRRAAVIACELGEDDRRLAAFVEVERPVEPADLRAHLRGELPPQMIPAHFRFLPQLPLTPNGKTDRRELEQVGIGAGVESLAPDRPDREPDRDKWFYRSCWVERRRDSSDASTAGTWLVFADEVGVGDALVDRLASGARVVTVRSGDSYHRQHASRYVLNPEAGAAGYQALARDLEHDGLLPDGILHAWLLTSGETFRPGSSFLHRNIEHGSETLEALAAALGSRPIRPALWLVTNEAARVSAGDVLRPEKAMALGACEEIRREHPHWSVSSIDIDRVGDACVEVLEQEIRGGPTGATVAIRGGVRWQRAHERFAFSEGPADATARPGTIWIAGGLGQTGLQAARALARPGAALVLIDLADPAEHADAIDSLRTAGAEVSVVRADVTHLQALQDVPGGLPSALVYAAGAKLRGALVLEELFRDHPLDFLALCSSHVFECPATDLAFLDAFARASAQPITHIELGDDAAAELLGRALRATSEPQVLISSTDPNAEDAFARATGDAHRSPRGEVETRLLALWREILRVPDLGLRDDFFDSGGDSLLAVRLLAALERTHAIDWPVSVLFDAPNVEACAARIEAEIEEAGNETGTRTPTRHLVPLHGASAGPGRPLFIASGAFGNVLNLRHIGLRMAADRPVYGLEAHGLHPGEDVRETIPRMAQGFVEEIREVQAEGPYLLAGFCSGGVVAFEMAHQLEAAGEEIEALFLLDSFLPKRDRLDWRDGLRIAFRNFRRRGPAFVADWARTRARWDAEQRERRLAREREPSPGEYRSELIFEKTTEALHRYEPPVWTAPITLFRPPLDPVHRLGPDRVVNASREWVRDDNGWSAFAPALEIREVAALPGDHDGFILEPHVGSLVAELQRRIGGS